MRFRRRRGRGFTVLELVVSIALLTLVGFLFLLSPRPTGAKAGSSAMAHALAMEFRQARQQAITSQSPVAIVFPGTDAAGARPYCTSFYQLEGLTAPKVTRVVDYKGDFPGCAIFNGSWSTDTSQYRNGSAPTNRANPTLPGQKWNLDLSRWLPASAQRDYAYVFCPDGTVRGNDLGTFDFAYHVLVSKGVGAFSATSAPSNTLMSVQPAYFTPGSLGETQTVTLDIGGSVTTSSGVACLSSGVTAGGDFSLTAPVASRALSTEVAPAPSVPVIAVRPDTPDSSAGAQVSVSPDSFVTLEASVTDTANSGQRLYCNWSVAPKAANAGSGPSDYSIPVLAGRGAAMDWDPTANSGSGAWRSVWQWRPPADGAPGDKYELAIVVQDATGANLTAVIKKEVKICPAGLVFYQGGPAGFAPGALYRMNPDGGNKRRVHISPNDPANPFPGSEGWPSATIDGSRIAFCSSRPDVAGGPPFALNQIYVTDRDGADAYRVSDAAHACELPGISPLGDLVAYRADFGGQAHIYVVNTDPNPANRVILDAVQMDHVHSMWNGNQTAPWRDLVLDKLSWDSHCDDPNRADTLYFTRAVGAGPTPTAIYKIQVQRNALGQPSGLISGPTLVESGVTPQGARGPSFFTDPGGSNYLFYGRDDGDPYIGNADPYGVNTGVPACRSLSMREEQPCAWMDGTTLRLFAIDATAGPPFATRIVRLTPPMSLTGPPDRTPLTPAGMLCLFPTYLPPAAP